MFGIDSGFIALAFIMLAMTAFFFLSEASAKREAKRIETKRDRRKS